MSYHEVILNQLRAIMPNASAVHAEQFIEPLNAAMHEFEIDTPTRQAAFLAQIAHESGSLRYVRELARGDAYSQRSDLGNTRGEAISNAARGGEMPGPFYKGRGLIQVTGYDNYAACSMALFGETGTLTRSPGLLERADLACRSATWYWSSRGLNDLADSGDFEKITRRINGGLNGQADRLAHYRRAKIALGVETGGGAAAPAPFPQNNNPTKEQTWLHSSWQRFLRLFKQPRP